MTRQRDDALRKGWIEESDDGSIRIAARGNVPLVEPVKKREGKPESDASNWKTHVRVSISRDERVQDEPEPAPKVEPPKGIPAETLRLLRYAVFETIHKDGTRRFKHDPRIEGGSLRSGGRCAVRRPSAHTGALITRMPSLRKTSSNSRVNLMKVASSASRLCSS
jgi:hypothetical protein